jgi:hypothetical protein
MWHPEPCEARRRSTARQGPLRLRYKEQQQTPRPRPLNSGAHSEKALRCEPTRLLPLQTRGFGSDRISRRRLMGYGCREERSDSGTGTSTAAAADSRSEDVPFGNVASERLTRPWSFQFDKPVISLAFHGCGRLVNPTRPDVESSSSCSDKRLELHGTTIRGPSARRQLATS